MPLKLGYKASAEQFAPRPLLDFSVEAERQGLDIVAISDHFQPFRHTGGHGNGSGAQLQRATGERDWRDWPPALERRLARFWPLYAETVEGVVRDFGGLANMSTGDKRLAVSFARAIVTDERTDRNLANRGICKRDGEPANAMHRNAYRQRGRRMFADGAHAQSKRGAI